MSINRQFLIHEGLFVFGNMGELYVKNLYDAYCNTDDYTGRANHLPKDYFVSGTYKGLPYEATIDKMDKITVNKSCELMVSGADMLSYKLIVHPNQKFWLVVNDYGSYSEIRAKDINKVGTKIASLNGTLNVDSIGWINEPQQFYILETGKLLRPTNDFMRSLYVSNLLLLPIDDMDIKEDLPFFIEEV